MVSNRQDIEILIALYLKGEASPEQAIYLEDWKSKSDENLKLFLRYEKLFAYTHATDVFESKPIDIAWQTLNQKLKKEPEVIPFWKNRTFHYAAASIILLVFIGYYLLQPSSKFKPEIAIIDSVKNNKEKNRTIVATNGLKSITLEDLSTIELSKGSKLILDKDFNKKKRELTLVGSGTFTVTHDEKNPFILRVQALEIIDLGTKFNVKSDADTIKIVVYEGKVALKLNEQTINMQEGDSSFYVIKKQFISRYAHEAQSSQHVFKFDGTNLKEVALILSEFFHQQIIIMDKEIESCPLTVTFKNENLATILDIIKELLDLEITKKNNIIEIHGESCN